MPLTAPLPELTPVHEHPSVPWTGEQVASLLRAQHPSTLPNIRGDGRRDGAPVRLLPHSGPNDRPDYVLRTQFIERTTVEQGVLPQSIFELARLARAGQKQGIARLVVPCSVFTEPHTPKFTKVYTVMERIGTTGKTLDDCLKLPRAQKILLAIGHSLVEYFGSTSNDGPFLTDISTPAQFSDPEGCLYDFSHGVGKSANEIGEELEWITFWVGAMIRSKKRQDLLERVTNLQLRYPKPDAHWEQ